MSIKLIAPEKVGTYITATFDPTLHLTSLWGKLSQT